jgi:beta-lactamase class A
MKTALITALLIIYVTSACSRADSPHAKTDDRRDQESANELQNQVEQIASAAKGQVGVAAVVLETGEAVSLHPHDHFPMQSVYKLPIGMAVMHQVDAGKIRLDQKVSVTKDDFISRGQHSPIRDQNPNGAEVSVNELLRYAISESDGTA